jgi:hypothetical protein
MRNLHPAPTFANAARVVVAAFDFGRAVRLAGSRHQPTALARPETPATAIRVYRDEKRRARERGAVLLATRAELALKLYTCRPAARRRRRVLRDAA